MWGTELWTSLEDLDICDYRRDPGLLGPAPQCCLMRVESCSIFVFLCMEAGWWVLPQSHLSSTDTMFKMAFCDIFFFFPFLIISDVLFWVWFCYGLYIMNTNIPRLFIFIKNKAVLYTRTSFIFHSVCRLSNSFPSSMSQC